MNRISYELFTTAYINRKADDASFDDAVCSALAEAESELNEAERNLLVYRRTVNTLRVYYETCDISEKQPFIFEAIRHAMRQEAKLIEQILDYRKEIELYTRYVSASAEEVDELIEVDVYGV